ncbi:Semialdehyde dehydrogenase, NAD-binding [Dillenia turbinata]|uniref:Probable N-acetyl-gamma-glutamyl-phosphate reductase, chloroplastic n=1 Tax=Dillenia turbinata TaxID=194707 RepID=A0AAN8W6J0_9MAGN
MGSAAAFASTFVDRAYFLKEDSRVLKTPKVKIGRLYVQNSVASSPQSLQFAETKAQKSQNTVRIGVLGASGYTGSEIVRLLANHPYFGITLMTADRKAGQSIASVFPHLVTQNLPNMVAVKDADFSNVDAVFCCLPHGTTQEIIKGLPRHLKIVDLSADFRLRDISEYEEWYGQPHRAPELQVAPLFSVRDTAQASVFIRIFIQKEAVYGLTEILREEIQKARLVANPGCYPTSIQIPIVPLIKVVSAAPANLIKFTNIIIDAKSGVSGAGRGAKEANLYPEIAEGIHSYGITRHRHVPEIEQGLKDAANAEITVSFTPHLMPMSRGMQSTIYVEMASGVTIEDLYQQLRNSYADEEFVYVLEKGIAPHTRNVRGSNYCFMNVFQDRIPGRAIIISVIDNLVKGASGQALQNLNLMMGFPEKPNASLFSATNPVIHKQHFSYPNGKHWSKGRNVLCAVNMTANQSDDSRKINLDHVLDRARELWDSCPPPVKIFPWNQALENFVQLIIDLILAVVKYLCVPLFGVTSLSEMSYCAHERKMLFIPFPFIIGIALAGALHNTALEVSPFLKDVEVPWHLIAIAIFFTLLKLPGPYYPYWGRVLVPHLANGGLIRTLWIAFKRYRKGQKLSLVPKKQSAVNGSNHLE